MRKFILFFVLTITEIFFAQSHRFVYEYKFISDKNVKDSISIDYMNLDTDKVKSYFYNAAKYETDSANAGKNEVSLLANAKNFDFNLNYIIAKDFDSKKSTFHTNYKGAKLSVEDLQNPVWDLSNEFSKLGEMKIQKAITTFKGREWIAWFTTEINYQDGPYKFAGLPGLIVKIYDTENHHHFELIQIKKIERLPDFLLNRSKKITQKEYLKLMENFSYNFKFDVDFVNVSKDGTMSVKFKDGNYRNFSLSYTKQFEGKPFGKMDDDISKRMRLTNNPIELE